MPLTRHVEKLTEESAGLNIRLANALSATGLDFLIWASPSSCRSAEESKLWHPLYARKPMTIKVLTHVYLYGFYFLVGLVRFFSYQGFSWRLLKKRTSALLIIPDEITDHSPQIKTDYLIEDGDYQIDKLVFSRVKRIGCFFTNLAFASKLKISIRLFLTLLSDFIVRVSCRKVNAEYLDSFVILMRWVISHSWFFHWDFYHFIKKIISQEPSYEAVICLHEMHFYSRILWRVAQEKKKVGVTAQHAMIIPEKLWYFPHPAEMGSGCPVPDIFFVYSESVKEMLQPWYPHTRFLLCCSPRFSKWRTILNKAPIVKGDRKKEFVTFVSAIMAYDVSIMVKAIKNLIEENGTAHFQIRLRLHPHASIDHKDRTWMEKALKSGKLTLSAASLEDDILSSQLIIGANSTVLQEALLLRIPALSIFTSDFLHTAILPEGDDWNVSVEELSWERLRKQAQVTLDEPMINSFSVSLGISNPDLTTRMIYKNAPGKELPMPSFGTEQALRKNNENTVYKF